MYVKMERQKWWINIHSIFRIHILVHIKKMRTELIDIRYFLHRHAFVVQQMPSDLPDDVTQIVNFI